MGQVQKGLAKGQGVGLELRELQYREVCRGRRFYRALVWLLLLVNGSLLLGLWWLLQGGTF